MHEHEPEIRHESTGGFLDDGSLGGCVHCALYRTYLGRSKPSKVCIAEGLRAETRHRAFIGRHDLYQQVYRLCMTLTLSTLATQKTSSETAINR